MLAESLLLNPEYTRVLYCMYFLLAAQRNRRVYVYFYIARVSFSASPKNREYTCYNEIRAFIHRSFHFTLRILYSTENTFSNFNFFFCITYILRIKITLNLKHYYDKHSLNSHWTKHPSRQIKFVNFLPNLQFSYSTKYFIHNFKHSKHMYACMYKVCTCVNSLTSTTGNKYTPRL